MERSVGRSVRPVSGPAVEGAGEASARLDLTLVLLLVGEIATFAALTASGNMPAIVSVLYRALLTL